jgi:hypothetical protein
MPSHSPSHHAPEEDCLGRTCLKWAGNGELSPIDLQEILHRLGEADGEASGLLQCSADPAEAP